MNNVLGAKNLLPNNAESLTYGGITFTVNSDGSVTANGTATELVLLFYVQKFKPNNGNYILSGGIRNGAFVFVNENNGTTFVRNVVSIGNDTQFTLNYSDYDNLDCGVGIESGVTVNNETFYPMLRPASIQDNTYVPYSMTNRELSDNISNGYILIGTHRVRVTSNSTTTTYAGLINNLYSDSAAYINSLNSDAYYQLATARVPGSDIKYITNDIATNNSLSQLEQNLFMMIKIGATLFMYDIEVRNNASRVFKYNSDGTLTDVTNNVIGQERAIDFNFNLYRYNNN